MRTAALVAALVATVPAHAATFAVNSAADQSDARPGDGTCATAGGTCTVRAAIEETNALPGRDVVTVPPSRSLVPPADSYTLRRPAAGYNHALVILESLALLGGGASTTVLMSNGEAGVMAVAPASEESPEPIVTISGVTLQGGKFGLAVSGQGAGLRVAERASVNLFESIVQFNFTSTGAGILNRGHLAMFDTSVQFNQSQGTGGVFHGGGITNTGVLEIERSTIANNSAARGGGISNFGRAEITNSTISGNTATGSGGGIWNVTGGAMGISTSTITQNRANERTSRPPPGPRLGGGIFNDESSGVGMANTILAKNSDNRDRFETEYAPDCYSKAEFGFGSERSNLVGVVNDNCVLRDVIWGDLRFDFVGTPEDPLDPLLEALVSGIHTPLPRSPAIDRMIFGSSSPLSDCPEVDQRGQPRPIDGDLDGFPHCDIGAVEFQPPDDADGIAASIEDGAPNNGDGNKDGIPDRLQPAVASLPNAVDARYVTLVASEGSVLENVRALRDPSAGAASPPVPLPLGGFRFTVTAKPTATVTLLLPPRTSVNAYFKFGPEPGNVTPHWYRFDPTADTGASIFGRVVTLRFVDGKRGDGDLAVNGRVVDPGAPAVEIVCGRRISTIVGTPGADDLAGTPAADVISGLGGDDKIRSLDEDDVVCGNRGDDELFARGGDDLLFGGRGDDLLHGIDGADRLYGGFGLDALYGDEDRDELFGGPADDYLHAGPGNDALDGGRGADRCNGGLDVDTALRCERLFFVP